MGEIEEKEALRRVQSEKEGGEKEKDWYGKGRDGTGWRNGRGRGGVIGGEREGVRGGGGKEREGGGRTEGRAKGVRRGNGKEV